TDARCWARSRPSAACASSWGGRRWRGARGAARRPYDRPTMPKLTFSGESKEVPDGEPIGNHIGDSWICVRIDGRLEDRSFPIQADTVAEGVLVTDPDGLH